MKQTGTHEGSLHEAGINHFRGQHPSDLTTFHAGLTTSQRHHAEGQATLNTFKPCPNHSKVLADKDEGSSGRDPIINSPDKSELSGPQKYEQRDDARCRRGTLPMGQEAPWQLKPGRGTEKRIRAPGHPLCRAVSLCCVNHLIYTPDLQLCYTGKQPIQITQKP